MHCKYALERMQVRSRDGFAGSADQWFCFDDVNVEPWDISSLDKDCFGGKYTLDMQHYKGVPQVSLCCVIDYAT